MRFVFLLILGLVAACKPVAPPVQSQFLNIDSLLEAQVNMISKATLEKTIQVDDSVFQARLDIAGLKRDLEVFRELNLMNRSIYRDSYTLSVSPDRQSNLTVKLWTNTTDAPVKSLKVFYLDKMDRIKRIEAELGSRALYAQSGKKLQLDFDILSDTLLLESYSISGSQRYFWGAQRYFSINAVVTP